MTALARITLFVVGLTTLTAGAQGVEVNLPCDNPDVLPVVTVDDGVTVDVDTPVGIGVPFVTTVKVQPVDGGDYLIDLAGEEVGDTRNVDVSLSWTNGVNDDLTDYDMIVDGTVYNDISNPERAAISARHCQVVSVDEIYTYFGTPADGLTLDLRISDFNF